MPAIQIRTYEQILQRMLARVVSRSGLSDITESSALYHIMGASARELDDIHYQLTRLTDTWNIDTAVGIDLDERAAEIQPSRISRLGPQRATSQGIVFTRPAALGTTITIPAGTAIRTNNNILARTTREAVITPSSPEQITGNGVGRDSTPVPAVMLEAGRRGNVGVGAITGFVARPSNLSAVTNVAAFVGGADQESDDAFRERLKDYINSLSRCTVQALEFIALGIADPTPGSLKTVRYTSVFEDPIDRGNVTLYVDDGNGTAADRSTVSGENVTEGLLGPPADTAVGGEEFLQLDNFPIDPDQTISIRRIRGGVTTSLVSGSDYFLNPANGRLYLTTPLVNGDEVEADYTYYTGLIAEVQRVVDGDPADRVNYPGNRAAGVRVLVKTPNIRNIVVRAVLNIDQGFNQAAVISNVTEAINNYINRLGISNDVIRNELIERIMAVEGVIDVNLTAPTQNINILDNELPRSSGSVEVL